MFPVNFFLLLLNFIQTRPSWNAFLSAPQMHMFSPIRGRCRTRGSDFPLGWVNELQSKGSGMLLEVGEDRNELLHLEPNGAAAYKTPWSDPACMSHFNLRPSSLRAPGATLFLECVQLFLTSLPGACCPGNASSHSHPFQRAASVHPSSLSIKTLLATQSEVSLPPPSLVPL